MHNERTRKRRNPASGGRPAKKQYILVGTLAGCEHKRALAALREQVDTVRAKFNHPHPRGGPHLFSQRDEGKMPPRKDGPWTAPDPIYRVRVIVKADEGDKDADRAMVAILPALRTAAESVGGRWKGELVWREESKCRNIPKRVRGVEAAKAREAARREDE